MKFMSTFLALSMLLCATAPAMARDHYRYHYGYRNPSNYAALQQARALQYQQKTQMEANLELQRQQMNSYYNNPYNVYYSNPYPYYGNSYYYGGKGRVVNGVLNSIFR